ncbi:MAG: helix-turn-helix domain-containing protein [Chitinophagaceae bacterium]|nr:helix-turn-helix domain-containing protein [Chitinophagaceae bacterium]
MRQIKIATQHLDSFIEYGLMRGLSLDKIKSSYTNTDSNVVTKTEFYTTLRAISTGLNDPLMGIRTGEFLSLNALGLIYQISLKAVSVSEALYYLKDYINATLPIVQMDLSERTNSLEVNLSIDNNEIALNSILLETLLTIIGKEIRFMSDQNIQIILLSPGYNNQYPEGWIVGNTFSLKANKVKLKAAMHTHAKWQLEILVPAYLKFVESLKYQECFTNTVKITALNMAKPELPKLEIIADNLNITPRTFQRRLAIENITFRQINDELKKQLSKLLLQHKTFSVNNISDILGYTEPAAYIRAFKKWYGVTPNSFRNSDN